MEIAEPNDADVDADRGAVHFIILALLVIGLIISVLVAFVSGLDQTYQQQTNTSLFNKESKISQVKERILRKKEELLGTPSTDEETEEEAVENWQEEYLPENAD